MCVQTDIYVYAHLSSLSLSLFLSLSIYFSVSVSVCLSVCLSLSLTGGACTTENDASTKKNSARAAGTRKKNLRKQQVDSKK